VVVALPDWLNDKVQAILAQKRRIVRLSRASGRLRDPFAPFLLTTKRWLATARAGGGDFSPPSGVLP
jgi:hypothetical protein